MGRNSALCESCLCFVEYKVENSKLTCEMKGKKYGFYGKIAVCPKCGAEVYVGDIVECNLKALYDEYRLQNDIISLEKVLEIPHKYGIDKQKLSKLLGWNETTFSRYCEGYIPTKERSDKLKRIYDHPEYFYELLRQEQLK